MSKARLFRLFNLYPSEAKKSFFFMLLGMLWALGATGALRFSDTQFILHLDSEDFPKAYIMISLVLFGVVVYFLRRSTSIALNVIFSRVLLTGIFLFATIFSCIALMPYAAMPYLAFILKVFSEVFLLLLINCFWNFIDEYHDLQNAKRIYGLLSGATFFGMACAGLVVMLSSYSLFLAAAIILLSLAAAIFMVQKIHTSIEPLHDDTVELHPSTTPFSFSALIKKTLSSPFTLSLMSVCLLIQLIYSVTEYSYLKYFQDYFALNSGDSLESDLKIFMGSLTMWVSLSNIIFASFLYSRIVKRYSITSVLLIIPILFVSLFLGWPLAAYSLFFPITAFVMAEGLSYSIEDNNFNLLINAVPSRIKYPVRLSIESFVEPLGMLIMSSLLLFFHEYSLHLGVIIAVITLAASFILRNKYPQALLYNLAASTMNFTRSAKEWLSLSSLKEKKATIDYLCSSLSEMNEEERLLSYEVLCSYEDPSVLPTILHDIESLCTPSKIQALDIIASTPYAANAFVIDRLKCWIHHNLFPELSNIVIFYIAQQGFLHPEKAIEYLDSMDLYLRGAAICSFKKSRTLYDADICSSHVALVSQMHQNLLISKNEREICLGIKILEYDTSPARVDTLISFIHHTSIRVSRTAAHALAIAATKADYIHSPAIVEILISTNDTAIRMPCLRALGRCGDSSIVRDVIISSIHLLPEERREAERALSSLGLSTVPILLSLIKDTTIHNTCRILAARILGRLSSPQLHANLLTIVNAEIDRTYTFFYHAHTIQKSHPQYDLSLLAKALLSGCYSSLDFVLQLLSITGSLDDSELISRSLQNKSIKIQGRAVETLEKTCDPKIFQRLLPLIENVPTEVKVAHCIKKSVPSLTLIEILDRLEKSSSPLKKITAATLKAQLDVPNWKKSLRNQMESGDEMFNNLAYELLESCTKP
jgi:hypothetical protein